MATQRPLVRRAGTSMLDWPRRSEANVTRSKRVRLVTLMRFVPRSESLRRNVRASRWTDTTVPSNWRVVAAEAGTANAAAGATRTDAAARVRSGLFMGPIEMRGG